jgi:DNA-binding SARP family transcriptional activator/tetratricopeptide (TPR) repeat protein
MRCLGAPALFTVAGEQVGFRTRKHLALLIRMGLEPGKQFTRDYLADLLWPNAAPKLANHSLAQGLSVIKAKIARDAVVLRRATVGLAAGWIDVDVNHLSSNDVGIDGPFLDALEIESARPFEDWKDEYRARLIPQIRDCLVRQMDAARRIGDFPTVQRHAERLQDVDPLAEEAIRGIMEARAWASDRSGALKAFARFEAKLDEELGAKPGPDLVRMADLLRDGRRSTRRYSMKGHPGERVDLRFEPETLVGREREFSILSDAWQDVRRQLPRIIVVTSDPGVGKTTLVNAFAASCQMDGAVVARAQAYDGERELPFAVLGELIRQLATQRAIGGTEPEALSELTRIDSEILKAFPGVPTPVAWAPELTPLRIADAFLKTITAAAADSPVMLVVDDLHAADNASTAILHSVARKLCDTRVLLVLAGRTSELRLSTAWALASDSNMPGMRSLDLDVLPTEAAQQFVQSLVGSRVDAEVPTARLLRAAGGNPLALELLAREWIEHGPDSLLRDLEALNTHPAPRLGIPRAIAAVFERQRTRLDGTTRATLDLAAVLGRRLTDLRLYAALEISPLIALESLSRLKEEGFLRDVRGDLEFRNELIRAQAYYTIASSARVQIHRRVAELLAERDTRSDAPSLSLEVAWHFLRGGADSRAIPFAQYGAEAFLGIGAPQEAAEVLKELLTVEQSAATLRRTQLLLAKALLDQSKAEEAIPIINGLAAFPDMSLHEEAEVSMLRASAEYLLNSEPGEKYCDVATKALECAARTEDPHLISRALFECARAGTEQGVTKLVSIAENGIRDLKQKIDFETMPIAVVTQASCRLFRMDSAACLEELRQAIQASRATANVAQIALMHSAMALAYLNGGELENARDSYATAFELSRKVGDEARMSVLASNICVLQVVRGQYEDAIRWGEMSVALGESSASSVLSMTYTNLADAYLLVGRGNEALELVNRTRRWLVPKRRWKLHCGFLVTGAAFELIRGNTSLALGLIGEMEAIARDREEAVPIHGAYWKLRIFRSAHVGTQQETERLVRASTELLQKRCQIQYLDIVGAKSWLENRMLGKNTPETIRELGLFEEYGALGRRALLTAQGFLLPSPSPATNQMSASPVKEGVPGFSAETAH